MVLADCTSWTAKALKIPTIMVLHGGNLPHFAEKFPVWVRRVLNRAIAIVAPSPFLASEMAKLGFPVQIVPNVIDIALYPVKFRRQISPKLFWMRSFHPLYNPEMAVDVFRRIKSSHPSATFVMAGVDKGLEVHVKEKASQSIVDNTIRFPGFLDAAAKVKEFSDADIFINTNRIDNTPVAILEACAMGLPVVATNVGGLSDLLTDGENGLLVPDGDVEMMAAAIEKLLKDPILAERLSRNGRVLAKKSSWESVREMWTELFVDLSKFQDLDMSKSRSGEDTEATTFSG